MRPRKKAIVLAFSAVLALTLFITGCQHSVDSAEVENLTKLCKVWGYVKYRHPAFLQGKKDWDAELLELIPQVREAKSAEAVNELLHTWFLSLGEIDYEARTPVVAWSAAEDQNKVIEADTAWTGDAAYLGEALAADFAQFPEALPKVDRSKAPVQFALYGTGTPDFSNEPEHTGDYSDPNFRLLGLFRLWNAFEYYYPYLHLMDRDWGELLTEAVPQMLEGADQTSYELNLRLLANQVCDPHVLLDNASIDWAEVLAPYTLPISCTPAEGKLVVTWLAPDFSLPLEKGDVLLKIDGRSIEELYRERSKYFSLPRDEVGLIIWSFLLLCENETIETTVLRDGEELTLTCTGVLLYGDGYPEPPGEPKLQPYELLEGNIGLVNPEYTNLETFMEGMDTFRDTDGLIIDLRQYPDWESAVYLSAYLLEKLVPGMVFASPSQAVPGAYVKQAAHYGYQRSYGSKVYHYDKPVAVLISSNTMSRPEMFATIYALAENTVLIGTNSMGTDGNVVYLPLPGGTSVSFTSLGCYEVDGSQTQRIGIAPDIPVEPTIQGIKEGRDEVLEAAVEYIKNKS